MFCVVSVLYLCLLACGGRHYPRVLSQADSLLEMMPDSALRLLAQWEDSAEVAPERVQMYYYLLTVKAADKAKITHTSDSIIRRVVDYYEHRGDRWLLPEACYYAGRVYRDLGDAPQALDYLQRAAELLEGSYYYELQKAVYSQMGDLFLRQDVYEGALEAYKRSLDFQEKTEDMRGKAVMLCSIGTAFMGYNKPDSALLCYQAAYEYAKKLEDKRLENRALNSICGLYTQLGEYDSARYALQLIVASHFREESAMNAVAADFYHAVGERDSAIYYYRRLLEDEDMHSKQSAYWGLGKLAQEQGDSRAALEYLQGYASWTDTVVKHTNADAVRKMQALYNYRLREKETLRFMQENARLRRCLLCGCVFFMLLIGLMQYWRLRSRRKELQVSVQREKIARLVKDSRMEREQLIESNRQKIEELERRLQESREQNDGMYQLMLLQKKQAVCANEAMEKELQVQAVEEELFRQSEVYHRFHRAALCNSVVEIQPEDWEELQAAVDACYRNFTDRLRRVYPLSEMELKICLLLKVEIANNGIARIVGRSTSAIVSARKSLYEKFHGEKGSAQQWDDFIRKM